MYGFPDFLGYQQSKEHLKNVVYAALLVIFLFFGTVILLALSAPKGGR